MEELLEIKNKKERSRNELEELRLDVYREKNLLDSLRHQRASKEASLEHLRNVEAARAASRYNLSYKLLRKVKQITHLSHVTDSFQHKVFPYRVTIFK